MKHKSAHQRQTLGTTNMRIKTKEGGQILILVFIALGVALFTVLFIIGGALGFDEAFKASFNLKLSLSGLTMPHELARLVLTEQLYRATTILNSKSYHY